MNDNTPLTAFDDWKGQPKQASVNITRIVDWFQRRFPPKQQKPADFQWPAQTPTALEVFYGKPRQNLVYCDLAYPHKLSWNESCSITRFLCHELVKPSIERILFRVLTAYGPEEIDRLGLNLFGGCYAYRNKTGSRDLSLHAWGIAVDYDPAHNAFKWGRDRARFAGEDYETWWRIWEAEGWTSLGRERNFDWMHIQAARLI